MNLFIIFYSLNSLWIFLSLLFSPFYEIFLSETNCILFYHLSEESMPKPRKKRNWQIVRRRVKEAIQKIRSKFLLEKPARNSNFSKSSFFLELLSQDFFYFFFFFQNFEITFRARRYGIEITEWNVGSLREKKLILIFDKSLTCF